MLIFNTIKAAVFETKFFLEEVNTAIFLLLLKTILSWKKELLAMVMKLILITILLTPKPVLPQNSK